MYGLLMQCHLFLFFAEGDLKHKMKKVAEFLEEGRKCVRVGGGGQEGS